MRKTVLMMPLVAVFLLGTSQLAHAGLVTFDFNSLANGVGATGGVGVNGSIQNYMNNQLLIQAGGGTVVVGAGALTDRNSYSADNHITGGNSGNPAKITLGNSEGCTINGPGCVSGPVDTFIRNLGGTSAPNDRITMNFSNTVSISSVSFDFEIFPDGDSFPAPDFKFEARNGANAIVTSWTQLGVTPGTGGTWSRSALGAESSKQLMGHWDSGALVGVRTLNFIDWPAMIGIDNLRVCVNCVTTTAAVPEPASMLLLGTGIAGLFMRRKKRQQP